MPGKRQKAAVKTNLTFLYTNASSLYPKIGQFSAEIAARSPAVVVVTETCLHTGIPDSYVDILGYTLFRLDRVGNGKGYGGIAISVAASFNGLSNSTVPVARLMVPSLEAL